MDFSKHNNIEIEILVGDFTFPIHSNITRLIKHIKIISKLHQSKVKFNFAASPRDFVQILSTSSYIISDSFHALMFATIFHKNIFMLKPDDEWRKEMFDRIEEWQHNYIYEDILENNITDILAQISQGKQIHYNQNKIEEFKLESSKWLNSTIAQVTKN